MIFLFDTALNNNNALAQGATWMATKNRSLTPLDANFYRAQQAANLHNVVLMIGAQNAIINNNIAPALQALVQGESVIIIAHGSYQNRRLISEAGGVNVTATATTIVQHFLQLQQPPASIFIAACESGIALAAGSILSTVTGQVYNNQCVVGGYIAQAGLCTVSANAFNTDGAGNAINQNRYGQHIYGVRTHGNTTYHMGYDRQITTTYLANGNYSNGFATVPTNQLSRWIPGNNHQNVATICNLNDQAFGQNRIPTAISGDLEQVV